MVRIQPVRINGLRHFELYVRDVFFGLYVTRDDARFAARRWDEVFAGVGKSTTKARAAA